jgi:hypothetical protein
MCDTRITKSEIETIIEGLEYAIQVCYTAPENPKEQGYPFATGYSKSAMQTAIKDLRRLM